MLEFTSESSDLIKSIVDASNSLQSPFVSGSAKLGVSGWATVVMAAASILSLFIALRVNKKQSEQIQQQIDNQKQQWTDEFFLRYKQQKYIEFRAKFLNMIGCVRTFHKVMGPGLLGVDFFKPQAEAHFEYQAVYVEEPQTPEICLSDSTKAVYELINFMVTEELFINDIEWLYRDILSFSNSFLSFLQSVKLNMLMKASFNLIENKWISHPDVNMRHLYMKNWTPITRDDVHTSLLHAIKNKELLNDLPGDNSKIMLEVANDDVKFNYYLCVVDEWINMWRKTIDSMLLPTSKKLKLSPNAGLKEQIPAGVTVPQYIKVTPEDKE